MIKGFVFFGDGKIPFVIENYHMELFTDDKLLKDFCNEYNFKNNYILHGECYGIGYEGQKAIFLVECSIGNTCYLCCYIINRLNEENDYDAIGFQSPFLDDIFRFKYNYLELLRKESVNFSKLVTIYDLSFVKDDHQHKTFYRIGIDTKLGLLEDFDKKGELLIQLSSSDITKCFEISNIIKRFIMFIMSTSDVSSKQIALYKNDCVVGWFYCPFILAESVSVSDVFFCEFDVKKYVPEILNNLALDSGSEITRSIPLGHLSDRRTEYAPQRFLEQVMAFEYLFEKLESDKSKDKKFPLKKELKYMFEQFPKLLKSTLTSEDVSERIKEIRRTIVHGYKYYYDFKDDFNTQYLIVLLDQLIKNMSLKWIGFSEDEIDQFQNRL